MSVARCWPCLEVALPRPTDDDAAVDAAADGKLVAVLFHLYLHTMLSFLDLNHANLFQIIS
jgi:hypothetical protein